jgi:hypothetical protein
MADKLDLNYIDPFAFHTLLSLVLSNNYFSFENQIFLQIIGIAMGQISGPDITNFAVYFDEILAVQSCKPFYYKRFIDDLYLIAKYYFKLERFFAYFQGLKLISTSGLSINFLDLNININRSLDTLNFKLYIKPTYTYSYLRQSSNHPDFIFENIPKSIFIRFRRNSTSLPDFYYFTSLTIFHLCSKGYDYKKLRKIRNCIANTDRLKLKHTKTGKNTSIIYFLIKYFSTHRLTLILSLTY